MQCLTYLSAFILLSCALSAQSDSLIIQNSQPIVDSRYHDIDGSPYYFKDWVNGSVLRSDGKIVDNVWINYNGFSREMEVLSGAVVYALDKRWHLRIDVLRARNPDISDELPVEQLIFQQGAHRELADRYSTILFLGEKLTLIRNFDVGKVEKEFNDVGKTILIKRFKDQSVYYLKRDKLLIPLKLHKKRIAEAFDNDVRITDFLSKEKLDLGKESDLVRLVAYAETLQ